MSTETPTDVPTDSDFIELGHAHLRACLMCGLVAADRDLHRDFHRWMNGTARATVDAPALPETTDAEIDAGIFDQDTRHHGPGD